MVDQEKEIQALKEELSKANEEIEKLSRIKSDFISIISHELRTPLTSIKESVSIVMDGVAGPLSEEQKKFLNITKNNIDRLVKLIIDILDMSKLEAGRITMHKRKTDINSVIKNVYATTKIDADKKKIEFSLALGEQIDSTWLDPDRINQVLRNLISNAIKFNKNNGKIKISSSKENINSRDFVKIIVEDNGIGIPAEDMENLFRNLSPLDTSTTRKYGGAGLGLVISKGIIELHGGNIWVVSEPEEGSKFIFTIPIYKEHEEYDFFIEEAIEKAKMNDMKIAFMAFEIKEAKDRVENIISEVEEIIKKTVRGPEDKVTRCKKFLARQSSMADSGSNFASSRSFGRAIKKTRQKGGASQNLGECIAIIAGTDRPGATAIVKRIKLSVRVPLIFGVSIYPDESMDKDELIKNAEEDLKSGKNTIIPKKILLTEGKENG